MKKRINYSRDREPLIAVGRTQRCFPGLGRQTDLAKTRNHETDNSVRKKFALGGRISERAFPLSSKPLLPAMNHSLSRADSTVINVDWFRARVSFIRSNSKRLRSPTFSHFLSFSLCLFLSASNTCTIGGRPLINARFFVN